MGFGNSGVKEMISYAKKKDTPNRKARKSARNTTFWKNYTETRKRKAELRRQRKAAVESEE